MDFANNRPIFNSEYNNNFDLDYDVINFFENH